MSTIPTTEERHFRIREDMVKENFFGAILYRIEATRDSLHAKKGEFGGWIESEKNIKGNNAWVADDAEVFQGAVISGKGLVKDNATVLRNSRVMGEGVVKDHGTVQDSAVVLGKGSVEMEACLSGGMVSGNGVVSGAAEVSNSIVCGNTVLQGNMSISLPISLKTDKVITGNKALRAMDMFDESNKPHYDLTGNVMVDEKGFLLYQARATEDFITTNGVDVSRGELGGYVEDLSSLQEKAWVEKDVVVHGGATVFGSYLCEPKDISKSSDIELGITLTENALAEKKAEVEKKDPISISFDEGAKRPKI